MCLVNSLVHQAHTLVTSTPLWSGTHISRLGRSHAQDVDMLAPKNFDQLRIDVVIGDNRVDLGWIANSICTNHAQFAGVRDGDDLA